MAVAYRKEGHQVTLLSGDNLLRRPPKSDSVKLPYVESKRLGFATKMSVIPGATAYFLSHKFDVIHAHDAPFAVAANLARSITKAPVVFTPHYYIPPSSPYSSIIRMALKADAVIAISNSMKKSYEPYGVAPRLVYNGVDTNEFFPAKAPASKSHLTGLFVGRLTSQKGIDVLLKALVELKHGQREKLKILIAGSGDPSYKETSLQLGLGKTVEFLGRVEDDKLSALKLHGLAQS
jgi:glycosyltransferase involved in cell wall biosynthesis